jgi:hypothetical protein
MKVRAFAVLAAVLAAPAGAAADGAPASTLALHAGYGLTEAPDRDTADVHALYLMLGYEHRLSGRLGLAGGADFYQGDERSVCSGCTAGGRRGIGLFALLTYRDGFGSNFDLVTLAGASAQFIDPTAMIPAALAGCDFRWYPSGPIGVVVSPRLRLGYARFDDSDYADRDSLFLMFTATAGPIMRF